MKPSIKYRVSNVSDNVFVGTPCYSYQFYSCLLSQCRFIPNKIIDGKIPKRFTLLSSVTEIYTGCGFLNEVCLNGETFHTKE